MAHREHDGSEHAGTRAWDRGHDQGAERDPRHVAEPDPSPADQWFGEAALPPPPPYAIDEGAVPPPPYAVEGAGAFDGPQAPRPHDPHGRQQPPPPAPEPYGCGPSAEQQGTPPGYDPRTGYPPAPVPEQPGYGPPADPPPAEPPAPHGREGFGWHQPPAAHPGDPRPPEPPAPPRPIAPERQAPPVAFNGRPMRPASPGPVPGTPTTGRPFTPAAGAPPEAPQHPQAGSDPVAVPLPPPPAAEPPSVAEPEPPAPALGGESVHGTGAPHEDPRPPADGADDSTLLLGDAEADRPAADPGPPAEGAWQPPAAEWATPAPEDSARAGVDPAPAAEPADRGRPAEPAEPADPGAAEYTVPWTPPEESGRPADTAADAPAAESAPAPSAGEAAPPPPATAWEPPGGGAEPFSAPEPPAAPSGPRLNGLHHTSGPGRPGPLSGWEPPERLPEHADAAGPSGDDGPAWTSAEPVGPPPEDDPPAAGPAPAVGDGPGRPPRVRSTEPPAAEAAPARPPEEVPEPEQLPPLPPSAARPGAAAPPPPDPGPPAWAPPPTAHTGPQAAPPAPGPASDGGTPPPPEAWSPDSGYAVPEPPDPRGSAPVPPPPSEWGADPAARRPATGPQTGGAPAYGPPTGANPAYDPYRGPGAGAPAYGPPAGRPHTGPAARPATGPHPAPQQPFQYHAHLAGDAAHGAEPGQAGRPETADDLRAETLVGDRRRGPSSGWRKMLHTATFGLVDVGESAAEQRRAELTARARTHVAGGHHRVAVLSLKGGVGKTTTTVGLGSTLASLRGDRVLAVDANPDRGTLSDKVRLETAATIRDLLNEKDSITRYADIRGFTSQAVSRLEILASDRDPAVSEAFSEQDYREVSWLLEHYYSICLTDCGTGLLHSAMRGVLGLADQVVLVSSASVDGARSASATLDWLEAHQYGSLVRGAVVVLSMVRTGKSAVDLDRLEQHFASRCRAVVRVPWDAHLEEGAEIDLDRLAPATRDAYLQLAATVGEAFAWPR
ncbi:AAA family ATPase [Streptomonospora sp. S1-112]|uniref:AAA family ATPase n=1 Tax=Streptomonospora mangrovi TaxID=2883123 RepID=A0A9X3SGY3_9ACTN|nr:AAA family ATPase [Streptomonospora mangrovi]MDA0564644.1 AAA family ATPase [Streptomonospora mangrovi]